MYCLRTPLLKDTSELSVEKLAKEKQTHYKVITVKKISFSH